MTSANTFSINSKMPLDASFIPETTIRYFNGPTAGFIDLESAQREFPWLVGGATICLTAGQVVIGNEDKRKS